MTKKLKILIVDDVDDQIEDIMSLMLSHANLNLSERVNLAKEHFDFITFNSVDEAIRALEAKEHYPDLAFCDLNFSQLPEIYPESERHHQKGEQLITWLRQHRPDAKIILHTAYIGDDVRIIRNYSDISYPTHRTSEDLKKGIEQRLKDIAQQYFLRVSRDPKKVVHLRVFMESAATGADFLAYKVDISGQQYALKYLLLAWAKADFNDNKPTLEFPDIDRLKTIINTLLNAENKADFAGNLNKNNVLNIINTYLAHQNHDNWCDEIRQNALLIVKETIERWNGDAVKNPTLESPILRGLSTKLDSIVNGNANLDEVTIKTLLRLLTCRLVIVSIHYLKNMKVEKKSDAYFRTIASEHIIDFSVLAILKNKMVEFGTQVENCQKAIKKNQQTQVHATVKKLFSTELGLRGDLAKAQNIEEKALLKEEKEWLSTLENQLKKP